MLTTSVRIWGKRSAAIHCFTGFDTTNVLMCLCHRKVVTIKLIENQSQLVHLHSKQGRKREKLLISDMEALTCAIYINVNKLENDMFLKR